jgi:hypothetical protein
MIVKTKLSELQDELAPQFERVSLKGQGASSFLYLLNKGRAVEISEDSGGFWLEFWEKSDDEDAPPVKEMILASGELALRETRAWLT